MHQCEQARAASKWIQLQEHISEEKDRPTKTFRRQARLHFYAKWGGNSLTNTERFHFGTRPWCMFRKKALNDGALNALMICLNAWLWLILQSDVWIRVQQPAGWSRNTSLQHVWQECTIDLSVIFLLVYYCVLLYFIVMHPQIILVNLYLLKIQYHAIFAWYPQEWVLHLLVFQDSNFQCAKRHNWKRLVMSQRAVAPLPAKFRLSKPFLCPPLNRWRCHQSIGVSKEATTDNCCWRL